MMPCPRCGGQLMILVPYDPPHCLACGYIAYSADEIARRLVADAQRQEDGRRRARHQCGARSMSDAATR